MTHISCSVIIITKNEERNIGKCIESVHDFAEIFVVDSMSADRTQEIARSLGARVVPFQWTGKYPKKKQWCLDNLPFTHDWVLWVDADEEVLPELAGEIRELFACNSDFHGYFIPFDYVFLDRVLKHGQQIYKLVLHHRHRARFIEQDDLDVSTSGDQEVHVHPAIDGRVGVLRNTMLHNDHDSLHHYFDRHNWYSDWEASLRARKLPVNTGAPQPGLRGTLKRAFDRLPGKPAMVFLYSYLLKQGFRDRSAGFHYAVSKAVYYWQIGLKVQELKGKSDSGPSTAQSLKHSQSTYYDEETDTEFETTRPHGTPRMYQRLLDDKFARSVAALGSLAGKTALTVCGGSGMDAEYLARAGATVIHSDLSPGATTRAHQRFQRFPSPRIGRGARGEGFVIADVEHLPFPDHSIDLVYVHDGLHHLQDPLTGLREMCRVARHAVSLTEPAQAAATRLAVKLGKAQDIEDAGNRVARLGPAQIARILEQEGFQIVANQRYAMYYKHHPGPIMLLLSLPGIHQLAWLAYRAINKLIANHGNKLTIQATRKQPLLEDGEGQG